jgi:hypothetical protein
MISGKKPYCLSFETGLIVANVREDPRLRPARTAGRDDPRKRTLEGIILPARAHFLPENNQRARLRANATPDPNLLIYKNVL